MSFKNDAHRKAVMASLQDKQHWNRIRKIAERARAVVVTKARCKSLSGMCFDASAYLQRRLASQGIDTKYRVGNNHAFLTHRGKIIDITATQFGPKYGKVVIRPHVKMRRNDELVWDSSEYGLASDKEAGREIETWHARRKMWKRK